MVTGGGLVDAWGGAVQLQGGAACGYLYTIDFQALTPDICGQLVPQLAAPGEAARGLTQVVINGAAPLTTLPPNPSAIIGTAAGQCGQNATADVQFTYKLRIEEQ